MRPQLAFASVLLVACNDLYVRTSHPIYELVGPVSLDEPWRDGETPRELAAALSSVPGTWVAEGPVGSLDLAFSAEVSAAAEYTCVIVDIESGAPTGGGCSLPDTLFFEATIALSGAAGTWAAVTDQLFWNGELWGLRTLDNPVASVVLTGPLPPGAPPDACATEYGLHVWRSLELLDTTLLALCADGSQEEVLRGNWVPDALPY